MIFAILCLYVKVRKAAAKFSSSEACRWEGCTVEMEQEWNYLLIVLDSCFKHGNRAHPTSGDGEELQERK